MTPLVAQLDAIEHALDAGTYQPGAWQHFLEDAARATPQELRALADQVTRVSEKLHARNKASRRIAPELGMAFESLGLMAGLTALAVGAASGSALVLVVATLILATTLQPLLKVSTGIALGIRYAYAYLWRGEPRFKLRYGSYLATDRWRRVVLHLSGTLGTPLGTALGSAVAAASHPNVSAVFAWIAVAFLLFQAAILLLARLGMRRLPVLGLLRFTSAGAAGFELRPLTASTLGPGASPGPDTSPVNRSGGRAS